MKGDFFRLEILAIELKKVKAKGNRVLAAFARM